ncbi:hypothetical protein E4T42_07255 [Aureobasidium subglaciale]|nr:hypothetical protein E4T42_07255 [Aureobasidium subglaciale]
MPSASNCSTLSCLRSLSEHSLKDAVGSSYKSGYKSGLYAYGDFYYNTVLDGKIIQDYPTQELAAGHFSKVALMCDHTSYEGAAFTNFSINTIEQTQSNLDELWPTAGPAFFRRLNQLYPTSAFTGKFFSDPFFDSGILTFLSSALNVTGLTTNSIYWRAQAIYSDFLFDRPTYNLGATFANAGLPSYKLIFNAGTQIHGAMAPFLTSPPKDTEDPSLSAKMQDYWLAFVKYMDPNDASSGVQRPYWPTYLESGNNATAFSILQVNGSEVRAVADKEANPRCDFMLGKSAQVWN